MPRPAHTSPLVDASSPALLRHFGSPERFLEASRDELEAAPALPRKVAREIHEHVHQVR